MSRAGLQHSTLQGRLLKTGREADLKRKKKISISDQRDFQINTMTSGMTSEWVGGITFQSLLPLRPTKQCGPERLKYWKMGRWHHQEALNSHPSSHIKSSCRISVILGLQARKRGPWSLLVSQSAESVSSMSVEDTVLRAGKMVQ